MEGRLYSPRHMLQSGTDVVVTMMQQHLAPFHVFVALSWMLLLHAPYQANVIGLSSRPTVVCGFHGHSFWFPFPNHWCRGIITGPLAEDSALTFTTGLTGSLHGCSPPPRVLISNKQTEMTLLLMFSDKWTNTTPPTLSPKSSNTSTDAPFSSLHTQSDNHTSPVFFFFFVKNTTQAQSLRKAQLGTIVKNWGVDVWVMRAESPRTMSVVRRDK